jgi:hypothetical protein
MTFYRSLLEKLLKEGELNTDMKVLAVCAGELDKKILESCNFQNVVISNIDTAGDASDFSPYKRAYHNCERLGYDDEEFAFVLYMQVCITAIHRIKHFWKCIVLQKLQFWLLNHMTVYYHA